jgi:hypothetical protein
MPSEQAIFSRAKDVVWTESLMSMEGRTSRGKDKRVMQFLIVYINRWPAFTLKQYESRDCNVAARDDVLKESHAKANIHMQPPNR